MYSIFNVELLCEWQILFKVLLNIVLCKLKKIKFWWLFSSVPLCFAITVIHVNCDATFLMKTFEISQILWNFLLKKAKLHVHIWLFSTLIHRFLRWSVHARSLLLQGRIHGVSCVFMDAVKILGKLKKINVYYHIPVRKGQVMVGNYFNVFRLVG